MSSKQLVDGEEEGRGSKRQQAFEEVVGIDYGCYMGKRGVNKQFVFRQVDWV